MPDKCILYYTCNSHRQDIELACRKQLLAAKGKCDLVSVSREPIEFGMWNVVVDRPRSPGTMHMQILEGLERIAARYVFLCESDVLYHPSHFQFEPWEEDVFYYNTNVWRIRYDDGRAVWTDNLQQVSGLCASRELLLGFYRLRVDQIVKEGFNRHYEPGQKTGNWKTDNWQSTCPNLDIRHSGTLTRSKWSPDEFRNQKYAKGWREVDSVPCWGSLKEVLNIWRD